MPYEIQKTNSAPTPYISTRRTTNLAGIGDAIGDGFGELMGRMEGPPAGAPFVIYHDIVDAENEGTIELCIPVGEDQADAVLSQEPIATTTHQGPYAEVAAAYHELIAWIGANGLEPAGAPRETYLNDPQLVSEADLLTRIDWPIQEAN